METVVRRALLFSYHFPPSLEAGAQRWDVFTRAGVKRGWRFDVLTAARNAGPASHGITVHHIPEDRHWLNQLSDKLVAAKQQAAHSLPVGAVAPVSDKQVMSRADISFPTSMADLRRNLRALLLHTHHLPWANATSAAAERLLRSCAYDAVISSGPPHLAAEAARSIAVAGGIPLVLDFRDPWSLLDVLEQGGASWTYLKLASTYERKAVGAASLVVMNTAAAERTMRAAYPSADIITIPNGFNGTRPTARHSTEQFVAIYAGTIYLDRDPRPLLAAVAKLAPELGLTADNFQLRFYGAELEFAGQSPEHLAAAAGVPHGLVESRSPLPRRELFEIMESAALLVNLPQGARLCVPSKVYEYLHFSAWVLGLESAGSATHEVLSFVGADIAEPGDVEAITRILRSRILAYRAGERPTPLAQPDQFFAPNEAHRFFDALESRLESRSTR
jgi:glycosyltransferase involved in cell wall biosynthesis